MLQSGIIELDVHSMNRAQAKTYIDSQLKRAKKEDNLRELLMNIDALVDSPFIMELKSYNVPFRGSSNQRIIDTRESLKEDRVCEILKYKI